MWLLVMVVVVAEFVAGVGWLVGFVVVDQVQWAHGVVVSHPLSMREALGSIPSVSICMSSACQRSPRMRWAEERY